MKQGRKEQLREACEQYPRQWHLNNGISAEVWAEILELLYDGQGCSYIIRKLTLPEQCLRSLQVHRRKHVHHITRQIRQRYHTARMSGSVSFAELYEEAREEMGRIAGDEARAPMMRILAFRAVQQEAKELARLMEQERAREETEEEEGTKGQWERLSDEAIERIRSVYSLDAGDGK